MATNSVYRVIIRNGCGDEVCVICEAANEAQAESIARTMADKDKEANYLGCGDRRAEATVEAVTEPLLPLLVAFDHEVQDAWTVYGKIAGRKDGNV